ncbi:hypothetical protein N0V90_001799 [Kalmusia sp. IMI 367209]|nr:hypothetical protein N0V90_001799 [Kalmusia sp. IMI 367209]
MYPAIAAIVSAYPISHPATDPEKRIVHLFRRNAYAIYKKLFVIYELNRKGFKFQLDKYQLALLGCHIERECAAKAYFTPPNEQSNVYKQAVSELLENLRELHKCRRCYGESVPGEVLWSCKPAIKFFTHLLAVVDVSVCEPRRDSIMGDAPDDDAVLSQKTPDIVVSTKEIQATSSSENDAVMKDVGDGPADTVPLWNQIIVPALATEDIVEDPEGYRSKCQLVASSITTIERECLSIAIVDESETDTIRKAFAEDIFILLKTENDMWTKRHGALGISDARLKRAARKVEDVVASLADNNLPDPNTFITPFTDREVYERERMRVEEKMRADPLSFFKNTVRKYLKNVSFVEDDAALVIDKYCVKRDHPARPSALKDGEFGMDFHTSSKRTTDDAFGRREVSASAPKRYCLADRT